MAHGGGGRGYMGGGETRQKNRLLDHYGKGV